MGERGERLWKNWRARRKANKERSRNDLEQLKQVGEFIFSVCLAFSRQLVPFLFRANRVALQRSPFASIPACSETTPGALGWIWSMRCSPAVWESPWSPVACADPFASSLRDLDIMKYYNNMYRIIVYCIHLLFIRAPHVSGQVFGMGNVSVLTATP